MPGIRLRALPKSLVGLIEDLRRKEDRLSLVLSLFIGALVGLVVVAFILLTGRLSAHMYPAGGLGWRRILVPTLGSLLTGYLLYRYFPLARGSGIPQTRAALFIHDGRISLRSVVMNEKRGAGLWDAAAAREWEIAIEQVAGQQRAQRRNKDSSPPESASRVHVGGKSSGKKNECDDDQADERADEKAEDEGESVLLSAEVLDQSDEALRQSSESYAGHLLKLQGVTAARVASRSADRIRCVSRPRSEQL